MNKTIKEAKKIEKAHKKLAKMEGGLLSQVKSTQRTYNNWLPWMKKCARWEGNDKL